MKAFIIGDIHGEFEKLMSLTADIPSDTLIYSVGDLIDRGPDSRKVIDYIRCNNIQAVKGNHECMAIACLPALLEYVYNPDEFSLCELYDSDWFYNGGHDIFNQYKATDDLEQLITDIKYLDTLPFYIETGILDSHGRELLISHTWSSYKNLPVASTHNTFVWDRDQPSSLTNLSRYYNVFGHTPVDYVLGRRAKIPPEPIFFHDIGANIDLGAPYTSPTRGKLGGIFFPSLEYKTA